MHSIIEHDTQIGRNSVIEYCNFSSKISIGPKCLLSNCECDFPFEINAGVFLMTVPFDEKFYATVMFGTDVEIKKNSLTKNLIIFRAFEEPITLLKMGEEFSINVADSLNFTLWDAKIHPVAESSKESFLNAIRMLSQLNLARLHSTQLVEEKIIAPPAIVSMNEILKRKNLRRLILNETALWDKIIGRKAKSNLDLDEKTKT